MHLRERIKASRDCCRPLRSRMRRYVEVNESTAVMFDDEEHVQHSKRAGHRDKKITSDERPCMITKECRPALISSRSEARSVRVRIAPTEQR